MSKPNSNHFTGTLGDDNSNTSVVWSKLETTQETYANTSLPKSFTIDTIQGKMWTHANGTKHMNEAIISIKNDPILKGSDPKLYTQFILFDYWKNLNSSVKNGIIYEEILSTKHWEFIFSKPRNDGKYPVVKHAVFKGLK